MRICKKCGATFDSSQFIKSYASIMEKQCLCAKCTFWYEHLVDDHNAAAHTRATINGEHYVIGPEKAKLKGFNGIQHVIRFNDGHITTTSNLWYNGEVPKHWKEQFPNNAEFITLIKLQ